jgi:RHS repeat-associated protein
MNVNRIHIAIMAMLMLPLYQTRAQDPSQNYVKTVTMLDGNGAGCLQSVQYFNGLGYPTVSLATAGTNGETACALTTYDGMGREARKYVPVPGNGLGCMTESRVRSSGYGFYQDNSAFTQNHYDALDRVTAVDIAGDKWRQAGAQDITQYLANTADDAVLHFEAPEDGSYSLVNPENTSYRYYPAGSLSKVVSYDADEKSVTVFTDLSGHKILERTAAGDTYYVYNDLGQLRFVLTPAYNEKSRSKAMFAYEYRYDNRGRTEWKKLPDTGHIKYWYDDADRVMAMQDAMMRNESKYRFFVYDNFGRVAIQGLCSQYTHHDNVLAKATYGKGSSGFMGTGYAVSSDVAGAFTNPELEIVNYYDNYDFIGRNLTGAMPTVTVNDGQKQYAVGFLTGQVVYATNGEALGSVNVYDQKGQAVRSVRKGLKGYLEDVSTAYTFTGDVESTSAEVDVKYGSRFTAETAYSYDYGKKTSMTLAVSHGQSALPYETEYTYDAVGRLIVKKRHLNPSGTNKSFCSYAYDVHGWLTCINSGDFQEQLYYADGLDGGCYNGNISTVKWKTDNNNFYQGYNLKYDNNNRLTDAVFGGGDNLTSNKDYFDEYAEYDCNGNITHLRRRGLVDNMHGGFGLVDNLNMTYNGNMLTSVCDNASRMAYAGATDFDGVCGQEYPLTYNDAGSLVSDAGRKIARIDYDLRNNPVRIQFTNGNVTKYVYSAAGEKLRVIYQTAVPNITVAIGCMRELAFYEIQHTDSTDYLLGGSLTLKNGRIDKYLFDEGYCQAEKYAYNTSKDNFTFCYYDRDHLGNIRKVREADGSKGGYVIQTMDYYPFGAQFCHSGTDNNVQPYRYNGKEYDRMHGLNTYDYGARQYNPITARWDRIDPLAEKNYPFTPYSYCAGDPVNNIDPDGKDDYKLNAAGQFEFWRKSNAKTTDRIYTLDGKSNITINKTTTKQLMADRNDYDGHYAVGGVELQDLFKFCSDNSNVEWRLNGYKNKGKTTYLIATSHEEDGVGITNGENNELDLFVSIHSHPGDSPAKASGYGKKSVQGKKLVSTGDDQFNVNDVYLHFNNAGKAYPSQYPRFYIYHTKTQTRIGYDPDRPRTSVKKIRKASDLIP